MAADDDEEEGCGGVGIEAIVPVGCTDDCEADVGNGG